MNREKFYPVVLGKDNQFSIVGRSTHFYTDICFEKIYQNPQRGRLWCGLFQLCGAPDEPQTGFSRF